MSIQFQPPLMQPMPATSGSAPGLRMALAMLMNEALSHGYHFCALHIRVAISELDEVVGDKMVL